VQIARAAGAVVVQNPWPGFGAQRNVAIDHSSSDWILEVDADEWLTPELAREIQSFLRRSTADVSIAVLPMRQRFLGSMLGPSAHYPFYRPRMFRKGAYRHDERRTVHEGLYARTRPWVFSADMHHELAESWREAFADAWAYARLEARQLKDVPIGVALRGVLLRPPVKFVYQLVLLGGWHDGWRGTVKIGLDSLVDVLVWMRYLIAVPRRRGSIQTHMGEENIGADRQVEPSATVDSEPSGISESTSPATDKHRDPTRPGRTARPVHYGRRDGRVGPIRLVLICSKRTLGSAAVNKWLADIEHSGAWVSVISDSDRAPSGTRVHRIKQLGPLSVLRALDAERQLGPLDGVVAKNRLTGSLLRLLPSSLRSYCPILDLQASVSYAIAGTAARMSHR
jgi:hypothetical protein